MSGAYLYINIFRFICYYTWIQFVLEVGGDFVQTEEPR